MAADSQQLWILIVDDHPYIRRAVRTLLESQNGWEVAAKLQLEPSRHEKRKNCILT